MTAADVIPALAILAVVSRELIWLVTIGIFLSGVDDLLVDLIWLGGIAGRRRPQLPPSPATAGRFAVLVPAWDESAVIGAMLTHLLQTQHHREFHVFVGVYPNDPATIRAVEAIADQRLIMVMTRHDGPTTKADCLNELWQAVLKHERDAAICYKAIVLHDAEDVVHPASLDCYDRWMPQLAMVQIPVVPFVDRQSRWVSGHYLDEFAENHGKAMLVRGLLDAPVPSAGVGTAIDRLLLERLAAGGQPFDAASLTEDYELGYKVHALGLKARLVEHREGGELVATREYFPATIASAVQQKSRWQAGIAFAGWDRIGWQGNPVRRWMLFRDRKGPACAALAMMGYATLALVLCQMAVRSMFGLPDALTIPGLSGRSGEWLRLLFVVNIVLLGWRLLMRAYFTAVVHGVAEGMRAIPRAVVANVINYLAALRAIERYRRLHEGGGQVWGKTAHRFPRAGMTEAEPGHV